MNNNTVKTFLLLGVLTAMFGGAGLAMAGTAGAVVALGVAAALNTAAWWFSDKIVLGLFKAEEVKTGRAYEITKELATRANMPMPRVCIMNTSQPNAFATGRSPEKGVVAVTTGIMDMLDDRELRGVIAHELAHIKNRDTLTMTMAATMAGALSILGNMALYSRSENRNPLIGIGVFVASLILVPIVRLAVSRTREYAADRSGAEISDDPEALASALKKIDAGARSMHNDTADQNPAMAHMFIVNPMRGQSGGGDSLFSTHPSTENRVQALYNYAAEKRGEHVGNNNRGANLRPRSR